VVDFVIDKDTSDLLLMSSKRPDGSIGDTYKIYFAMCTNEQATSRAVSEGRGCNIEYPQNPTLNVNGMVVHPPRYAGLKNKPHTAFAVDITKFLHIRPGQTNKILFAWQNSLKRYVAVLELVRRKPLADIVARIKETRSLTREQVLLDKRAHQFDDDVAVDAEVVSLKDPVSKLRIQTPARASTCHHTQCFDLLTFFQLTEAAPNFTCPVCNRPFEASNLIVDGWFEELLRNTHPNVQTAEVDPTTMEWKITKADSDDDSDEEGEQLKRELARQESAKLTDGIINLDSDDEASASAAPRPNSNPTMGPSPTNVRMNFDRPRTSVGPSAQMSPPRPQQLSVPQQDTDIIYLSD